MARIIGLPSVGTLAVTTSLTTPQIYGSTSASGSLTLNSTSNATKGFINFGAFSAFDEANIRLGIGATAPSTVLHILSSAPEVRIANTGTGTSNQVTFYDNTSTLKGHVGYAVSSTAFDVISDAAGFLRFGTLTNVAIQGLVNAGEVFRFTTAGLGLMGDATVSYALSFNGNSARTIGLERHTTNNTAGNSLTIRAGDATTGATDKTGGDLILKPGISTGNAVSGLVRLQGFSSATATGTSDNSPYDRMVVGQTKLCTDAATTTLYSFTVANGSQIGGIIHYCIEVTDGTDYQNEVGSVYFNAVNKAGTVTRTITEVASQQALSSGATLSTTFAISNANPAVLSVVADTSLASPSAGYPRIIYNLQYFGQQAFS